MALLKTTEIIDYGDEEFEYSPMVISPPAETYPYPTAGDTRNIRTNAGHKRGRLGSGRIDNLFIDRIRALAEIWHNVLTQPQRDSWRDHGSTSHAERPRMKGPATTGWNCFAQVGLAFIATNHPNEMGRYPDAETAPDAVTLESAVAATRILTINVHYNNEYGGDDRVWLFIHQVDPAHILKRDWSRRAYLVGCHQIQIVQARDRTFTANAVYFFQPGDTVQALLRIHKSYSGADNILLSCIAT